MKRARALLGSVFSLCAFLVLQGCGTGAPCRSDADCGAGAVCASSGGVLFGERICVSVEGAPGDAADAEDTDGGVPLDDACVPATEGELCAQMGFDCGTVEISDGCGRDRTVDCGVCPEGQTCGGGGSANVCGCSGPSAEEVCAERGAECGNVTFTDDCGVDQVVTCGECGAGRACGLELPNQCACDPATYCEAVGRVCGAPSEQCENLAGLVCGDCGMGSCTTAGGEATRCECQPGYAPTSSGLCADEDECSTGTHDCAPTGSICTNEEGSYTCACDEGAGFYGDGRDCRLAPAHDPQHVWTGNGGLAGAGSIDNLDLVPDALYIVVVALREGEVVSMSGMGTTWVELDEVCGEGGTVEVWYSQSPPQNAGDIDIGATASFYPWVAVAAAWTNAEMSPTTSMRHNAGGNDPATGACTGSASTFQRDVFPTHSSSVVLAGAGLPAVREWGDGGVQVAQHLHSQLGTHAHLARWGPPVLTPQPVSARFTNDDFAAVTFEIIAAP